MTQSNADRIRIAHQKIMEEGKLDLVEDFFSADYVAHGGGKDHHGLAFVRRYINQLRTAIPNLCVDGVEILLQTGDRVAWQRTLRGTHEVALMGIPPSGKTVEWRDQVVTRFAGGKFAEDWVVSELAGELLLKLPPS